MSCLVQEAAASPRRIVPVYVGAWSFLEQQHGRAHCSACGSEPQGLGWYTIATRQRYWYDVGIPHGYLASQRDKPLRPVFSFAQSASRSCPCTYPYTPLLNTYQAGSPRAKSFSDIQYKSSCTPPCL